MAQVHQLGPKVGSHLALFCIHHMIWVNSRNDSESRTHDDSTIIVIITL